MDLQYIDPEARLLLIALWNEWDEDTGNEPVEPPGLAYLDVSIRTLM